MFGFTEAQVSEFGVTVLLGGLIVFMLFIVGELAWKAKAGKFGAAILFLVLGAGIGEFVFKLALERMLGV